MEMLVASDIFISVIRWFYICSVFSRVHYEANSINHVLSLRIISKQSVNSVLFHVFRDGWNRCPTSFSHNTPLGGALFLGGLCSHKSRSGHSSSSQYSRKDAAWLDADTRWCYPIGFLILVQSAFRGHRLGIAVLLLDRHNCWRWNGGFRLSGRLRLCSTNIGHRRSC